MTAARLLPAAAPGHGQLDYALARLHHRLARIPGEGAWAQLAPLVDYHHYLDAAARQPLADWLGGLSREADVHGLEQALRQRHVEELRRVAGWLPPAYAPLLRWCEYLPYLDFAGFLQRREPAPEWMQADPRLAAWLEGREAGVLAELLGGQGAAAGQGRRGAGGRHRVNRHWLAGFWRRLPEALAVLRADARFRHLLEAVVEGHPLHEAGLAPESRTLPRLLREAHHQVMQAPLAALYPLLVHWLLLRLRAELVPRRLDLKLAGEVA